MKKRRILVTLESRATYGYAKNVMLAMRDFPTLELCTVVTGMHLLPLFGHSIDLIRADGFPVSAEVPLAPEGDGPEAWSRSLGRGIAGFSDAFAKLAPDIVMLSGDRVETFGCCVAAAYMNLPSAHIQAGDKSGHVDDMARMAIAKLAHIHLASCEDSADRLRRLGEQEFRIFNVGAPQLDDIVGHDYAEKRLELAGSTLDLSRPYILLVMHPVLVERDDAAGQMTATIEACIESGLPVIWIYPNADLGAASMLTVIDRWRGHPRVTALSNVERGSYLTLLANASALVGNSSSGILEAPSFRVAVVNIGNRQRGRMQATNIINCDYPREAIVAAIRQATRDPDFQARCAEAVNPYGDGRSGRRICEILRDMPLDRRLLDKETVY